MTARPEHSSFDGKRAGRQPPSPRSRSPLSARRPCNAGVSFRGNGGALRPEPGLTSHADGLKAARLAHRARRTRRLGKITCDVVQRKRGSLVRPHGPATLESFARMTGKPRAIQSKGDRLAREQPRRSRRLPSGPRIMTQVRPLSWVLVRGFGCCAPAGMAGDSAPGLSIPPIRTILSAWSVPLLAGTADHAAPAKPRAHRRGTVRQKAGCASGKMEHVARLQAGPFVAKMQGFPPRGPPKENRERDASRSRSEIPADLSW